MPEAITKYAINSTLGTEDFESIDQMILGSKGLKASDNFYTRLLTQITVDSKETFDKTNWFEMKWSGTFKLNINCDYNRTSGQIRILKNGSLLYAFGAPDTKPTDYFIDSISVTKGDIIGIIVKGEGSNGITTINYIDMYADIIDLSAFKML